MTCSAAGALRVIDHALAQSLRRLDPATPDLVLAGAALASLAVGPGPCRLRPGAAAGAVRCATMDWPDAGAWNAGAGRFALDRSTFRTRTRLPRPRRWCWRTACSTCAAIASTNAAWRRGLQQLAAPCAASERSRTHSRRCSRALFPRRTTATIARRAPRRSRCCVRCCWSPAAPAPARPPPSRACCCC